MTPLYIILASIKKSSFTSAFQRGMLNMFDGLRDSVVPHYSKITLIASAFAAVFVIINLIKIVSQIEGDDQAGGFGHVKLWDIIRPIIFYMLVCISPKIVSVTDTLVKSAVDGVIYTLPADHPFSGMSEKKYEDAVNDWRASQEEERLRIKGERWDKQIVDWLSYGFTSIKSYFATVMQFIKDKLGEVVIFIVQLVFLSIGTFYLVIASIHLMLIMIFAPFMFALSILEPWKRNYQKLIANMVYYELWYPIVGLINTIYAISWKHIMSWGVNTNYMGASAWDYAQMVGGNISATIVQIFVQSLVTIVCCLLLTQVPAIAKAVIDMGASVDSKSDSGTFGKMASMLLKG